MLNVQTSKAFCGTDLYKKPYAFMYWISPNVWSTDILFGHVLFFCVGSEETRQFYSPLVLPELKSFSISCINSTKVTLFCVAVWYFKSWICFKHKLSLRSVRSRGIYFENWSNWKWWMKAKSDAQGNKLEKVALISEGSWILPSRCHNSGDDSSANSFFFLWAILDCQSTLGLPAFT